jgi:hypothetical protein
MAHGPRKEETMCGPKVSSLEELAAQIGKNRGWMAIHVGVGLHSLYQRSAVVFEEARIEAEDRNPVEFLHCELSPAEAVECPLTFGATPFIHVFHGQELLESVPAPESGDEIAELVEFALSYYAEKAKAQ